MGGMSSGFLGSRKLFCLTLDFLALKGKLGYNKRSL